MESDDVSERNLDGSRSKRQSTASSESKFVWIAVESLPSSEGIHVLRGDEDGSPSIQRSTRCPQNIMSTPSEPSSADSRLEDEPEPSGDRRGHAEVDGEASKAGILDSFSEVTAYDPVYGRLSTSRTQDPGGSRRQVTCSGVLVSRSPTMGSAERVQGVEERCTSPSGAPDRCRPPETAEVGVRLAPDLSDPTTATAPREPPDVTYDSPSPSTRVLPENKGKREMGENEHQRRDVEGNTEVVSCSGGEKLAEDLVKNSVNTDSRGVSSINEEAVYAVPSKLGPSVGRGGDSAEVATHRAGAEETLNNVVRPSSPTLDRCPVYEDIEDDDDGDSDVDHIVRTEEEGVYETLIDSVRPTSGAWDDSSVYEDVEGVNGGSGGIGEAPFSSRHLDARRQLSSDSSWSEEFESMSEPEQEPEDVRPADSNNFEVIRHLLRRTRRSRKDRDGVGSSQRSDPGVAVVSRERKSSAEKQPVARKESDEGEGRLSRWFSLRKSSHYDISSRAKSLTKMSSVNEDSEAAEVLFHRRHQAPALPPAPVGLTSDQLKRRHIVQSIVHSENNYVNSLQSLVNDYKKVLEESHPPVVSSAKIPVIFHRIPEILQCHTLFRIALSEAVRQWDVEERIGDVFVASFSKGIVLDIYSDFINNFSVAMEAIKQEAKRKSAFADFLKMRQISSPDRLSLFGLMVKPVQRFPQFILLLQDLLKHTPHGHHDRMSLQLALTQLESLAEMLNERKRESEQFKAFRETLRRLNGKFSTRSLADNNRYLLREDNVTRLEFGTNGIISKSKNRRLFLLNDLVVCVSVSSKTPDDLPAPPSASTSASSERLTLKWSVPVTDVEIQEASTSLTLSHVITATVRPSAGSRAGEEEGEGDQLGNVGHLCQQMSDLMHDYEVVSRIGALVSSLKGEYPGLTPALTSQIASSIQRSIRQKDEEIAWLDACCLQLAVRRAGREEHFTFQMQSPAKKLEWTTDFRLAQLALDGNNSPAWDVPEREQRPITRVPLFVKTMPVTCPVSAERPTEVLCGCFYALEIVKPTQRTRRQSYLWICTSDGDNSYVVIYAMQQVGFRDVHRFELPSARVTAMQHVPGEGHEGGCRSGSVWISTEDCRLLIFSALDPEHCQQICAAPLSSPARRIVALGDAVFAALEGGSVAVFDRAADGAWLLNDPYHVTLGQAPVTCLIPIGSSVYAGCGRQVSVIDVFTRDVTKSFTVHEHESSGGVHLLAHSGIGLWISLEQSSTICLYHTETFRHLQDINIASNIARIMGSSPRPEVTVTALLAGRGLLWVGTSVGVTLTIPLPRLEGVPIISGRGNISYHAHCGPVRYIQVLSAPHVPRAGGAVQKCDSVIHEESADSTQEKSCLHKQRSDTSLSESKKSVRIQPKFSSPALLRKRSRDKDSMTRRLSKTLPRGFGLSASGSVCDDVYGLYGDLLNLHGLEEPRDLSDLSDHLRRSDPELATGLQHRASSLDQRLRLRSGRPRSLDLSSWSVDSRCSTQTASSSSDGDRSHSAPASRAQSFRTPEAASASASAAGPAKSRRTNDDTARSVLTVMGGRGYVNWSKNDKKNSTNSCVNARDAHLVLWEMKL